MKGLEAINESIYRLVIPFEDIFTTVFFVKTPGGTVVFDTATYAADVDQYIEPALTELGITAKELQYVVLSHSHRDHAGGLERFLQKYPDVCVVTGNEALREKYNNSKVWMPEDGAQFLEVLRVVAIPGHTADCNGILDTRSGVLLTGDCLQMYGIYGSGNWGANIGLPTAHLEALEKLGGLQISTIIASHDYHPHGYRADGQAEIARYLEQCAAPLYQMRDLIQQHEEMDDEAITAFYNHTMKLPTMGRHVFGAIRRELCGTGAEASVKAKTV